jgi:hypothetical protein
VHAFRVGWVIVDTVNRVMPGAKENSPEDMGMFLHNLNLLRHETNAHVTGVHHGTQEKGTKSRGHSSLPNGADVILQVEWTGDTKGTGRAIIGFARDDTTGLLGTFGAEEVVLGKDEDGDDETTLLINEMAPGGDAPTAKPKKEQQLTDQAQRMRTIIANALASDGGPIQPRNDMPNVTGIDRDLLRDHLVSGGWFGEGLLCDDGKGVKLTNAAYAKENNALTALERRGFFAFNREYVWAP